MGNFSLKFDKFWETFIKYNGYVKVLEGLKNTLTIAVLGLIIGIVIGTLIATARVIPQYKVLPRILNKICSAFQGHSYRGTASCILLCPASSDGKPYDRYPGCRYGIRS